jgi:hypothetical protein
VVLDHAESFIFYALLTGIEAGRMNCTLEGFGSILYKGTYFLLLLLLLLLIIIIIWQPVGGSHGRFPHYYYYLIELQMGFHLVTVVIK